MRILQVIPVFSEPFGGPVTVVRSISKELAKRHDVTVYTTTALDSKHDFNPKEEEVNGYKVIYFPRTLKILCYSYLFGQLNLSLSMMKSIRKNLKKFDIVHIHSWQQLPDIIVHYYATKYNVPYILQVHGSLPRIMTKQKLKWIYDVFFGYRLLKDVSRVIALDQTEVLQYKLKGVPKEKITIIPNGIDLSDYADLPPKGCFKKKFHIPEDKKIILYLGRIHKIKGIDFLVKAYALLIKNMKFNDAILVIAGPDDGYLDEIKVLIKSLNINDKCLITGPLYDLDKLEAYIDADVYILPSRYEIWGMTALEAVACGAPIIISENCGVAKYLKDKVGFVVKPDSNYFAEALYKILLNKDKQSVFRKNCKILIKKFSISKVVSELEKVYESSLKKSNYC
jgi:glycosyltransferase involved in cell wall biosynthesis